MDEKDQDRHERIRSSFRSLTPARPAGEVTDAEASRDSLAGAQRQAEIRRLRERLFSAQSEPRSEASARVPYHPNLPAPVINPAARAVPGPAAEAPVTQPPLTSAVAAPPPAAEEWRPLVDPRRVARALRGGLWIVIVFALLGTVCGLLAALSMQPKYLATAELLVDPRTIRLVDSNLTSDQLPTDASLAIAESQARIIESSSVLLKVIGEQNLVDDPEMNGTLPGRGIAAYLDRFLASPRAVDAQTRETVVLDALRKRLTISRDAKTFIFSISVITLDPEKSARLANAVSDAFQQELNAMQSDAAKTATEQLSGRLATLRGEVELAENEADAYRADHDLVDVQGRSIGDDELVRLNDQLAAQRAETTRLDARQQVLKSTTADSVLAGALPEELRSNTIAALRSQYSVIRQQVEAQGMTLGPRHPRLIQLRTQADGARREIEAELARIRASLDIDLQRSRQQEQDLNQRLDQLKARQAETNVFRIKLRDLEREASARRAVYEAFLLRSRQTGEQSGLNTTNVRTISMARPPLDPTGGGRKIAVIAGLIAGLALGMVVALAYGLLRRRTQA